MNRGRTQKAQKGASPPFRVIPRFLRFPHLEGRCFAAFGGDPFSCPFVFFVVPLKALADATGLDAGQPPTA
jgi:hypothetical protein